MIRHMYKSCYEKTIERMIEMGEVVLFPRKEELPKVVKEKLDIAAKEYVEALYVALNLLCSGHPSRTEYEEVPILVTEQYAESVDKAIEELEDKSK